MSTPRRMAYYPVTLRDTDALADAVEASGQTRARIAATTIGLRAWKPEFYDSVSYQTIANLLEGKTLGTSIAKANAIEEALLLPPGTLFVPAQRNERALAG